MGKTTDDLLRLAGDVSSVQPPRELDMLLTSGERVSMAPAVHGPGRARASTPSSFTGSQAGIITDTTHTNAKIVEVGPTACATR